MSDPAPAPEPTTTAGAVIDDADRSRFSYVEGDHEAKLLYQSDGDRLDLVHAEVPDAIAGRGVGGRLVEAAVERAAASGETVVPLCSFVRSWLEQHPDEAATITIDWP